LQRNLLVAVGIDPCFADSSTTREFNVSLSLWQFEIFDSATLTGFTKEILSTVGATTVIWLDEWNLNRTGLSEDAGVE